MQTKFHFGVDKLSPPLVIRKAVFEILEICECIMMFCNQAINEQVFCFVQNLILTILKIETWTKHSRL